MLNLNICGCVFSIAALVINCGGGGPNRNNDDDEPERSGKRFDLEEVEYFDSNVEISAAGDKLAFISGRLKSLKAFKYEKAAAGEGADAAAPSRVSDEEYGEEIEVQISPNGSWLAFIANQDEILDIYVTSFADGGTVHKIRDTEGGIESNISFSPDSQYLLYTKRINFVRETHVSSIAGDGTPGDSVKISESTNEEYDPIWVPQAAAGSYRVVSKIRDENNFSYSLAAHDFSNPNSVTHATLTDSAKLIPDKQVFTASRGGIYFVKPNPNSGADRIKPIKPIGNKRQAKKVEVINFGHLLSATDNSVRQLQVVGVEILTMSENLDGSLGLWTVREAYLCDVHKSDSLRYRNTVILYNYTTEQLVTRIVPQKTKNPAKGEPEWVRSDDVCDNYIGEDKIKIDHDIVMAKLAANSTQTNFQFSYVTFFSGDSEVRLLNSSTVGEETTDQFYEVSNNKKP